MRLISSNQTESLLQELGRVLAKPLSSPFAQECIIAPNQAQADWLGMRLAEQQGAWTGLQFPFPKAALLQWIHLAFPQEAKGLFRFEPQALFWAILQQLHQQAEAPAFGLFKPYHADPAALWQIAWQAAGVFERYQIYRPDWLARWEQGDVSQLPEGDCWQGQLWQALTRQLGNAHFGRLAQKLIQRLQAGPLPGLPPRVCLFGLNNLPPLFLKVFFAMGEQIPVHFFHLSPTPHFWADLVDPRQALRQALAQGQEPETLLLEAGHPLLAAWGRLHREFQALLWAEEDASLEEVTFYQPPAPQHSLGRLQASLFAVTPTPQETGDEHLQVFACHSKRREVEQARQRILECLSQGVRLEQILLLAPEIGEYSSLLEEVFSSREGNIPYHLAEQHLERENPWFRLWFLLSRLAQERVTLPRVLELLSTPVIRTGWRWTDQEVAQLTEILPAANIRWAWDEDDRAAQGQPRENPTTFAGGLARLVLGICLPEGHPPLWDHVPALGLLSGEAALLGEYMEFHQRLRQLVQQLNQPCRLDAWLQRMQTGFAQLAPQSWGEEAAQQQLFDLVQGQVRAAQTQGWNQEVPLACFNELLSRLGVESEGHRGYQARGVTCASLRPMRSLPFAHILILGLNETTFPRNPRPVGFDLLPQFPRLGDRRPRDEDKAILLECLLSARQGLDLLFQAFHPKDQSPRPPSPLLAHLLEELKLAPQEQALHSFDPVYYRAPQVRGFSPSDAKAAWAMEQQPQPPHQFLREEWAVAAPVEVSFRRWLQFFTNPLADWFEQGLGVKYPTLEDQSADREPLFLTGLEKHQLREELRSGSRDLALTGSLPPFAWGEIALEQEQPLVLALEREWQAFLQGASPLQLPPQSLPLQAAGQGSRLHVQLNGLYPQGLGLPGLHRLKAKHQLQAWLQHLCLCSLAPAGVAPHTRLWGRSPVGHGLIGFAFAPVAQPQQQLNRLWEWFCRGLNRPLPWHPTAGLAFLEALPQGYEEAKSKGEKAWAWEKEDQNPYWQRLHGDQPLVIDPLFAEISAAILGPLLQHRREGI